MKIGPVDIRNHTFAKRKMRGCDEAEVTAFLELVADAFEEALVEKEELLGKLARIEAELVEYRDLDRTLRDSLLSAERLSDGRLEQAERESRIILKNAEVEAEKIIAGARKDAESMRVSIDGLRAQRLTYIERFRALLRSQARILEASLETFSPDLSEVEETLSRIDDAVGELAPFAAKEETPTPVPPAPPAPAAPESPERFAGPPPVEERPATSYLGEEGLFSRTPDSPATIEDD